MRTNHRSRAFAIDVQIADVEVADGAVDLVARLRVDRASKAELGVVGDFECVIESARLNDRQYGSENFLLLEFRFWRECLRIPWADEITFSGFGGALAAGEKATIFFALLNVFEDGVHRAFIDDRAHVCVFGGIADFDFFHAGFELVEKFIVNAFVHDRA